MAFHKVVLQGDVGGDPDLVAHPIGPWPDQTNVPWDPGLVTSPILMPIGSAKAPNHPADVEKVKKLINQVFRPSWPLALNGTCDGALVMKITNIQQMLGMTPDGIIGRTGFTLKVLNGLAEPAKITRAQIGNFEKGVYDIKYTTSLPIPEYPRGYSLQLNTGSANPMVFPGGKLPSSEYDFGIDVREQSRNDLLTDKNAEAFLDAVAKNKKWAKPCPLRLYLIREGFVVWQSDEVSIPAPVAPYEGRLTPAAIGADTSMPRMIYVGTGQAPFIGRRLWRIGKKYWFRYGSSVVTEDQYRGMDCINFVGSVYQVATTNNAATNPYYSSPNMASALGASPVVWTEALPPPPNPPSVPPVPPVQPLKIEDGVGKGKAIKKYFEDPGRNDTYLIWTGGHIRMVVRKVVHEWSSSANGYKSGAVSAEATVKDDHTYRLYSLPANRQF